MVQVQSKQSYNINDYVPQKVIDAIHSQYNPLPYHNFNHALSVTRRCLYNYLFKSLNREWKRALVFAALLHDANHQGSIISDDDTINIHCALKFKNQISKERMAMLYQFPSNHFIATELGTLVPNLLDWEFTKFGAYYIQAPEVSTFTDLDPLNPIIDKLLNQIETNYIESSFKAPIYKNKPKTSNFEIPYQLEDIFNHAKVI